MKDERKKKLSGLPDSHANARSRLPAKPRFGSKESLHIGSGTTERMISPLRCPVLESYGILLTGHSTVASGTFKILRPHPGLKQVLVVLAGRGRCWFNDQWHELKTADAFLSSAYLPHAYQATGKWELAWCMFTPDRFSALQQSKVASGANTTLWKNIILGILEEAAGDADPAQLSHWSSLLALQSDRLINEDPADSLTSLWIEVKKQLHAHWTLDALAATAGISIEVLRLRCLKEKNASPITYLTRLRMAHAADMLKYGLKVEYVARAVGYENPFSFSAAFHRTMGMTPSSLKPRRDPSSAHAGDGNERGRARHA